MAAAKKRRQQQRTTQKFRSDRNKRDWFGLDLNVWADQLVNTDAEWPNAQIYFATDGSDYYLNLWDLESAIRNALLRRQK